MNPTFAVEDGAAGGRAAEAVAPEMDAAYAAQGFAGVVELMRAHSDDAAWQCAGCNTLARLTRGTGAEAKACAGKSGDAGAVEAVLAAMRKFRGDAEVSFASVQALTFMVVSCERNCARACAVVDAFESLVAAMPWLRAPSAVQYCATLLARLAKHGDVSKAVEAGVLPALVAALHSTIHADVAFTCVFVEVQNLLFAKLRKTFASSFCAAGAVEVALLGSRAFPSDSKVQGCAFNVLHLLLHGGELDTEQRASLRSSGSGAVETVVAGMRAHPADAIVQGAGCSVLSAMRNLMEVPDCWLEISGVLDVVLNAMRLHRTTRIVQMNACNALFSALGRASSADRDRAFDAGCLAVVLVAWRTHAADANFLAVCVSAVGCMLRGNPRHTTDAAAAGVAELTLSALRAHPAAITVQNNAYILLHALLTNGGGATDLTLAKRLLAAGALQLALRANVHEHEPRGAVAALLQAVAEDAERAAELAAAELLAEEGAPAATSKKKSRSKKKGGAAAAAAAGTGGSGAGGSGAGSAPKPAAAAAEAVDAIAAPDAPPVDAAAASEPSAAAVQRQQRAATKTARRAGGGVPASAAAEGMDGDSDDTAAHSEQACGADEPAATATEPAHAAAAAAAAAGADGNNPEHAEPGAADAVPEAASAATDPAHSEAADAADAAASGAQLLGDIFPWLHVAPVPAAVAAPVLPPLPLAAQPLPLQQQAAPDPAMTAMAAENARLRAEFEVTRCLICLDAAKCTVLLPCRHLALCTAPACAAMLGAPPLCPLCRKAVADTMQLFV